MTLSVRAQLTRGALNLDVDLHELAGVTALVGPNGAGKTTLLRAIAGLDPGAQVWLDGQRVDAEPPHRRRIGLLLADPLLRPTARALAEVALPVRGDRSAASAALVALGAAELGERRCSTLSSGELSRVALARALAAQPRALLLDEPLSRLDAQARPAVRGALRQALSAYSPPVLLVTHDVVDVASLATRVVVLEAGAVVQDCAPAELTARPRSEWAARFAGLELLRGQADGTAVTLTDGGALTLSQSHTGPVLVAMRAASVTLSSARPEGSARNVFAATVTSIEPLGDRVRVTLDGPPHIAADLTPSAVAQLRLDVGSQVWAAVKATDLQAYPA